MVEGVNVAAAVEADAVSTSNTEPHEIRITDHGKIRTFVTFALNFLQVSLIA
jgi:hypothetical protein